MAQCVVKNKSSSPVKMHISKGDIKSDQILYPNTRVVLEDMKDSTISFDQKVSVTTRRKVGSCFPRIVKKTLKNVDSVDIVTYVSKITVSK